MAHKERSLAADSSSAAAADKMLQHPSAEDGGGWGDGRGRTAPAVTRSLPGLGVCARTCVRETRRAH